MFFPYRSILTPIQFDDPSLMTLGFAKRIAILYGATLHLLHVVPKLRAIGEPDVSEIEKRRKPARRSSIFPTDI